jgi:DNA-binding HxlR family transcriptional regulator
MEPGPTKTRNYGQYCGLARALELIGERWALLIVRDLLVGPRRFSDLKSGLPRIPTNVLSTRLKELELAGVLERRILLRPANAVVYELSAFGAQLESIVLSLGRWGAQLLGEPRSEERVTEDSLVMALRSTFRPESARGLNATFELHVGDIVLHARVRGSKVEVAAGAAQKPDLTIDAGPALKSLLSGELSPTRAKASGAVRSRGPAKLLTRFVEVFRIDRTGPARAAS